jgi:hypothetical protein
MIDVTNIPDGATFTMITKFGTNKVVKLCGDVFSGISGRPIAYFTFLDRPDKVSREQFIKGMNEEPDGRTRGGFAIWQFELDNGATKLEPLN